MPQLSKSTQTSLSEINMVPFVDVVLVLLIIFMITAPILQSGIEVDVPKTRTVKEINQERLVVTVDKAQRIYLGNESINIHQLGPRIKSQLKNRQEGVFLPVAIEKQAGRCLPPLRRNSSFRQLCRCSGRASAIRHQ